MTVYNTNTNKDVDFQVSTVHTKNFKLLHYPISGDIVDYSGYTDAEIVQSIFADWGDNQVQGMIYVSDMTVDQARDKIITDEIYPNIHTTTCSIKIFDGVVEDEVVEDDDMEDNIFPDLSFCTTNYDIECYCCTDQRLCFIITTVTGGNVHKLMYTDDTQDAQELDGSGAYYLAPVADWIEAIVKDYASKI